MKQSLSDCVAGAVPLIRDILSHALFLDALLLFLLPTTYRVMATQAGSSKISPVTSGISDEYNDGLQSYALLATKASTSLPPDIPFYRSVDNDFGKLIDSTSEKALRLTNRLLTLVSSSTKASGSHGKGKLRLKDQADVADRFESLVVDALDQLLENAVSAICDTMSS